jgi:hypothetical protein
MNMSTKNHAPQAEAFEDEKCQIPVKPQATVGFKRYGRDVLKSIKIRDRMWMPQEEFARHPVIQLLPPRA